MMIVWWNKLVDFIFGC